MGPKYDEGMLYKSAWIQCCCGGKVNSILWFCLKGANVNDTHQHSEKTICLQKKKENFKLCAHGFGQYTHSDISPATKHWCLPEGIKKSKN